MYLQFFNDIGVDFNCERMTSHDEIAAAYQKGVKIIEEVDNLVPKSTTSTVSTVDLQGIIVTIPSKATPLQNHTTCQNCEKMISDCNDAVHKSQDDAYKILSVYLCTATESFIANNNANASLIRKYVFAELSELYASGNNKSEPYPHNQPGFECVITAIRLFDDPRNFFKSLIKNKLLKRFYNIILMEKMPSTYSFLDLLKEDDIG